MHDQSGAPDTNQILARLNHATLETLAPHLELVELNQGHVLFNEGEVVTHVFFPNNAVISMLSGLKDYRSIEVATEGNESAVGLVSALAKTHSSHTLKIRHPGTAFRLSTVRLEIAIAECDIFWSLLAKYTYFLFTQVTQLGFCNRFHSIESRLARWLLMTNDRVVGREIHATQEVIAQLLGVRRSSISIVANDFLEQGLIHYHRGTLNVLDPALLEAKACHCYAEMKRIYRDSSTTELR